MPADRLLGTLLRSLQTYTDQQDTPRVLGTAISLLTTLNNPLNVTLLTSQLLFAPALWTNPEGLRTSTQSLRVFLSAAQALVRHERALKDKAADKDFVDLQLERTLPRDDWIKAVISGADDHSPRWRHLLVLGGLLLGFGPVEEEELSSGMRSTIESALVTATNLALEETMEDDELGMNSITLVLNYCFPHLAHHERSGLNHDALLPVLMRSTWYSADGLRSGYFLGAIDGDIQRSNDQYRWSDRSPSYQQVHEIMASPIISSFGSLARLIGHTIENVTQAWLVTAAMGDLDHFARTLHLQWRQNRLSEIDPSQEGQLLDQETANHTNPELWKLLRSTMFAVVLVLRSVIGRLLGDGSLANDNVAPHLTSQALRTLRNLYFISTKTGSAAFSQYIFVYLTAMDTLSAYPSHTEAFLQSIKPAETSGVPAHALDRNLDLFFLNTSEHFTLILPPQTNEDLLVAEASKYLAAEESTTLLPIFEASHSVMLAVFSAPQNAEVTKRHLPFYIGALFNVFPHSITIRQFRLAFKTLLKLTSPPAVLAATEPMLAATLLELLFQRTMKAPVVPLPARALEDNLENGPPVPLSEQGVLTLTIIDTLPQLTLELLDEWLPLTAELLNAIDDKVMREHCKDRFWHALVGGEMDPNRSGVCHDWWSTRGGRELLLFGREDAEREGEAMMSGALPDEMRETKL